MAKQDDFVRITLRLPRGLHESLTEAAGPRSLNAEIVSRLEGSFEADLLMPRADRALDALEQTLKKNAEDQRELAQYFRIQMFGMRAIIDAIAASEGSLDPEFMRLIKDMAENSPSHPPAPKPKEK